MIKTLRFLSWIAVSSSPQAEKESPEEQRRLNEEFVAGLHTFYPGYAGVVVKTIRLVGTRSIIELSEACRIHPEYKELIDTIKNRRIDAVICRSRDRIARSDALILTIERLCYEHDIVVLPRQSLPVTLDVAALRSSEGAGLITVIEGHIAQAAVRRLVHENAMGVRARVEKRYLFPSNVPWGYKYVFSEEGEQSIQVDSNAAHAARALLVDLFVGKRLSYKQISEILNKAGLPAPTDTWSERSVRHIVANAATFAGYITLNKRSRTGRELIHVLGKHEAVITETELAQVGLERDARRLGRLPRGGPFSGVVYCAASGQPLASQIQHYNTRKGTVSYRRMRCLHCSTQHSIAEKTLIACVSQFLGKIHDTSDPDLLLSAETMGDRSAIERNIAALKDRLADIADRMRKLVNLYVNNPHVTQDLFDAEMGSLVKEEDTVTSAIDRQRAELARSLSIEQEVARMLRVKGLGGEILRLLETDPASAQRFLLNTIRITVVPLSDGKTIVDSIAII